MLRCEGCQNIFKDEKVKTINEYFKDADSDIQKTLRLLFRYTRCCRECASEIVKRFMKHELFMYNLPQEVLDFLDNFSNM